MPETRQFQFGAFVVEAAFPGGATAFALGDGTVRLIDGGERSVAAHDGAILAAAGDDAIFTGGDDGRLVRTAADGTTTLLVERKNKWIDQVVVGPQGTVACAAGREAIVVPAKGAAKSFTLERAVGGLAFAPKGLRLAVARYNGVSLFFVNASTPPTELAWKGAHGAVSFSPDGQYVITAMQENALHGWRLADGDDMRMSGYPAKVKSLSWTAKGRYLATSGADSAVLWPFLGKDGPKGKPPLQLGQRDSVVTKVACHPKLDVVAIGYRDGAVMLAKIDDELPALICEPGSGAISALTWDKAGARLAYGAEDGAAGVIGF